MKLLQAMHIQVPHFCQFHDVNIRTGENVASCPIGPVQNACQCHTDIIRSEKNVIYHFDEKHRDIFACHPLIIDQS